MDIILISPMEIGLDDSDIYREENIQRDEDNIKTNLISGIYIKRSRENIGVGILAACLRQSGFETKVINAHTTNMRFDEIVSYVIKENPRMVGISLLYDLHAIYACIIVDALRKAGYKGHITWGGPYISFTYEYYLYHVRGIDSVIIGEGEISLINLLRAVVEDRGWIKEKGIAYFAGNSVKINEKAEILHDLSMLPMPARDSLKEMKDNGINIRVALMLASKGCNGRCTYCTAPSSADMSKDYKWRPRRVKDVIDEIEYLVREFNIEFLYFCDYNFFGYGIHANKWLNEFANEIINKNIKVKFHATMRADTKVDLQTLKKLKVAGLQYVLLGLESGSQSALDRWEKHITIKQNKDTAKLIMDMGFVLDPGMIMVDAYTTPKEFKETVSFIRETKIYNSFFPIYMINQLIAYVGTRVEQQLFHDGIIARPNMHELNYIKGDFECIKQFCNTVSGRNYEIQDKKVSFMWKEIVFISSKVEWLLEDVTHKFLGVWRENIMSRNNSDRKKNEKREYLKFVIQFKGLRKTIGEFVLNMLDGACVWLEKYEDIDTFNGEELIQSLMDIYNNYMERYFKEGIEKEIETIKKKYEFEFEY